MKLIIMKFVVLMSVLLSVHACASTKTVEDNWSCVVDSLAGYDLYLSPRVEVGDSVTLNVNDLEHRKNGEIVFGGRKFVGNNPFIPFDKPFLKESVGDDSVVYRSLSGNRHGVIVELSEYPERSEARVGIHVMQEVVVSVFFLNCSR